MNLGIFTSQLCSNGKEVNKKRDARANLLFCLINLCCSDVLVVVNFLSQVIFVFLLFLGMVMYANEVETKEK